MADAQPNNPLHGKTLEAILTRLVEVYGWERLSEEIRINCFLVNPSIKSSLTFCVKHPGHAPKWKSYTLTPYTNNMLGDIDNYFCNKQNLQKVARSFFGHLSFNLTRILVKTRRQDYPTWASWTVKRSTSLVL